jgi:hypothetical protein
MIDSEFDGFVNGKLGDHEVPVPAGLWEKLTNAHFDQYVRNKLKDKDAPVPEGTWDKITDAQFDGFLGDSLKETAAPVPAGIWDRINDGQFDSFVSGKLTGYEATVPAGLWDKVNPQPKDDDRGGFAWFRNPGRAIAVAAVLITLLGGYFWLQSSQEQKNTTLPGTAATQPAGGSSTPTPPVNPPALGNSPDANSNGNTAATQAVVPAEQRNDQANTAPGDLHSEGAPSVLSNSGKRQGSAQTTIPSTQMNAPAGNNAVTGIAVTGSYNNNATIPDNSTITNDFIEPYQFRNLQSGTTIPFARQDSYSGLKELTVGNRSSKIKSNIVCPTSGGFNTDWFLEAYLSPDFAFTKTSSNGASQQYMDRKDSSESMNPGFSAGIRVVKPLSENVLVKAGVQYTQMNQKYVYRTENEIKTITVVSLRTIIRGPGDTVLVRDTSILQQAGYKNNTVINRFRSLDVPLTVGYQFGNDDLKIGINAGVVVNVSSWYEGVMLDTALATVPIVKGSNNSIYKNRIGLGLVGGISIMKKLSDDLQVFAEPYFRYNLSNTTTPNAPFNQKFSVGGISLGVRLNLNKQ